MFSILEKKQREEAFHIRDVASKKRHPKKECVGNYIKKDRQ